MKQLSLLIPEGTIWPATDLMMRYVSLGIELMAFTAEHAESAREARRVDGRRQHPARLNFGDCLVYGAAKAEREPLLFKGNDFSQTDIEPALKD